ncbi:MAG: biotin-dependent carboxyltransferase family protein [Pseudoxanthomonas sp.]
MRWQVVTPGVLTTVQDRGREGWRHLGVARAGALDPQACALANELVGNPAGAAVLELTLHGPTLRLPQTARIAITGAEVSATSHGTPLPGHRPLIVPAGELKLGAVRAGIRAWLAVGGGFDVPLLMGSRSTDLRGGFGGLEGRALHAGDRLPLGTSAVEEVDDPQIPSWWIGSEYNGSGDAPIRFVAGKHPAAQALQESTWAVSPDSNRQGIRMRGDPLPGADNGNVSEPVAIGTLQLPPDGQPIVLLADAQTVGGYARLGHVIAADLPWLAQAAPGTKLSFLSVNGRQAHEALRRQQQLHARTVLALRQRLMAGS